MKSVGCQKRKPIGKKPFRVKQVVCCIVGFGAFIVLLGLTGAVEKDCGLSLGSYTASGVGCLIAMFVSALVADIGNDKNGQNVEGENSDGYDEKNA